MSIYDAPQPGELPLPVVTKLLINADGTIDEREALRIEADLYRRTSRRIRLDRRHNVARDHHIVLRPDQEECDAREQHAIADAVDGVIP